MKIFGVRKPGASSGLSEVSPGHGLRDRLSRPVKAFDHPPGLPASGYIVTTGGTTWPGSVDGAVDHVFSDSPFVDGTHCADLDISIEAWHGVMTAAEPEAIIDTA